MSGQWRKPAWLTGDEGLLRVGPGTGGDEEHTCPSHAAAKARPALWSAERLRLPKPEQETFTLGPVMDAIDRVEFDGEGVERALAELGSRTPALHPGHLTYVEHAVRKYLDVQAGGGEGPAALRPVRPYWVAQRENGRFWEMYAWWRRYESPDGRVREYRRLRHGVAKGSQPGEIAIAVYVAVHGRTAAWPRKWGRRFQPYGPASRPERVRVIEIGLADGKDAVQFDGTAEDAEAYFTEHGRAHVSRVVAGGDPVPGSSCIDCKQFTGCDAVTRTPGVLGLTSRVAPLRKVSASDLRYHRTCPAQEFLRSLHLPKSDEYGSSAKLGQAVHGWIEALHGREGRPACTVADMPGEGENWTGGRWRVGDDDASVGREMLLHHVDACPFQDTALVDRVEAEALRVVHDTAAQALVVAKPDLLYREDGSWVWRELKTTRKRRWYHQDLLDEFPQLALAVALLARGALGGDPAGSRIEVEVLRPDGSDLNIIDPTDPGRLEKALSVLRALAGPWRVDDAHEARPGPHCQWCPVSRWCPSAAPGERVTEGDV
ncbi:PD-(D/E)XK nuclease family protein [Streptomyces sp. NBC_01092]|uniref:PD-(D/E)XK nuclease family protein n=1 Tax=Streptomyces sp. NBC_01092 TaxID=2903748 RepID=UPI00386E433D|nr:PD-(D/E)XK nuclease family protein [Streptomyces sp. NBC_01092]